MEGEERSLLMDRVKNSRIRKSWIAFHSVKRLEDGRYEIVLTAKEPAFYVTVESGKVDGRFSENFLTLLPGEDKTIYFTPFCDTDEERLKEELSVMDISGI